MKPPTSPAGCSTWTSAATITALSIRPWPASPSPLVPTSTVRARTVEVGTNGDGEAGQGRMESAVIVAAEVQVLHPAGDVGGFIGRLRNASVGGGNARHADRSQQQEDQSWFGRQHAMIQGKATMIRTSATDPERKVRKVRRFQCCTCSG